MSLALTDEERVSRARADLRLGAPVALTGTIPEEGAALVLAAEGLGDARLEALRQLGPDSLDVAISRHRAETLRARIYDDTLARIEIRPGADAAWIAATADPSADLATPLKGPYTTRRGGSVGLHAMAIRLAKQARLLPAAVVAYWAETEPVLSLARRAEFTHIDTAMLESAERASTRLLRVSGARVPTRFSEVGRVHVFRPADGAEEHYAVEIGRPDRRAPVLARLHSACFTGDVIGSLKCDCGPQLSAAMEHMARAGSGLLLYMNQEGRGIGLANKMRAYALQDQGFDTVEANHRLGFEDDERDFRLGGEILKALGFSAVRLMTNNPAKVAMMRASGVDVTERVPLRAGESAHNTAYLATKAAKSGHLL